jgi:hypothetical protein
MSRSADLRRLQALAQLTLDHRLQALNQASDRLERSRMQLAAVNGAAAPADLQPIAAGLVDVAYRRWADVRRAELNALLARQTAEWIEARAEAATALGRVQALQGAMTRLR